jgi:hypothetical protein
MFQLRWGSGLFILYDFRLLDLRLFFLISAFQLFSFSAFQLFSFSAFQLFSFSAFQLFSVSAFTSLPLRELLFLFPFRVHSRFKIFLF